MNLWNNEGSVLNVTIRNCEFAVNFCQDFNGPNNHGRAASGGAIFVFGRGGSTNPNETYASVLIDHCNFYNNACDQGPNGGHGGAINMTNVGSSIISNSLFCSNTVSGVNADAGDLLYDRNAGGAITYYETTTQTPGHQHLIDRCFFVNNRATTINGASFPNQSEGGAVFLSKQDGPSGGTSAVLKVANSEFYENFNEVGVEHIDNNDAAHWTSIQLAVISSWMNSNLTWAPTQRFVKMNRPLSGWPSRRRITSGAPVPPIPCLPLRSPGYIRSPSP